MERVRLSQIDGVAIQHPTDREATDSLKKLFGFDKLVAKFLELRYERLLYIFNTGSSVQVGPNQFPRLYEMLKEGCAILDVPEPEMYVNQSPVANAFTFGHTSPYIMIYTGLIDLLNDDEMFAIVGHELGHIKCGHVLYNTMASAIRDVVAIMGQITLGIGRILGASIEAALMEWRRRAELSADRAALLTAQDIRPILGALTKLAGGAHRWGDQLSVEAFLEQARRYREEAASETDVFDMLYRSLAEFSQGNHPFAVERLSEIDAWWNGDEYKAILAGDYPRTVRKVQIKVSASE